MIKTKDEIRLSLAKILRKHFAFSMTMAGQGVMMDEIINLFPDIESEVPVREQPTTPFSKAYKEPNKETILKDFADKISNIKDIDPEIKALLTPELFNELMIDSEDKEVRSAEEILDKICPVTCLDNKENSIYYLNDVIKAMHEYASQQIDLRKEFREILIWIINEQWFLEESNYKECLDEYLKSRPEIK
jgi:hypothetical protein